MADTPAGIVTPLSNGAANIVEGDWPDRRLATVSRAELWSYPASAPRAQAVIYAGGGYTSLFVDKEGVEVALWLNGLGIDAHVLVHRLPGQPDGKGGVHPRRHRADRWPSPPSTICPRPCLSSTSACLRADISLGSWPARQPRSTCAAPSSAYAPLNANHRRHKYPRWQARTIRPSKSRTSTTTGRSAWPDTRTPSPKCRCSSPMR